MTKKNTMNALWKPAKSEDETRSEFLKLYRSLQPAQKKKVNEFRRQYSESSSEYNKRIIYTGLSNLVQETRRTLIDFNTLWNYVIGNID